MKRKTKIIIGVVVALIAIGAIFGEPEGYADDYAAIEAHQGTALLPDRSSLVGGHYQEAISIFNSLGFSNVQTIPMGDLITGWLRSDGEVSQIQAGDLVEWDAEQRLPFDTAITITHHSFPVSQAVPEVPSEPDEYIPSAPVVNPFTDVALGDIVQMVGYNWRVHDMIENRALLIAENAVTLQHFHNRRENVTWANSYIRNYLNGSFLNQFTETERAFITETQVTTPGNPWYGTTSGGQTTDHLFLLSIQEVLRYFGDGGEMGNSANERTFLGDDFNENRQLQDTSGNTVTWWLRTSGSGDTMTAHIRVNGVIDIFGSHAEQTTHTNLILKQN